VVVCWVVWVGFGCGGGGWGGGGVGVFVVFFVGGVGGVLVLGFGGGLWGLFFLGCWGGGVGGGGGGVLVGCLCVVVGFGVDGGGGGVFFLVVGALSKQKKTKKTPPPIFGWGERFLGIASVSPDHSKGEILPTTGQSRETSVVGTRLLPRRRRGSSASGLGVGEPYLFNEFSGRRGKKDRGISPLCRSFRTLPNSI